MITVFFQKGFSRFPGKGAGDISDIAVSNALSQQIVIEHESGFLVFRYDQIRPVKIVVRQCPGQRIYSAANLAVMGPENLPERIAHSAGLFRHQLHIFRGDYVRFVVHGNLLARKIGAALFMKRPVPLCDGPCRPGVAHIVFHTQPVIIGRFHIGQKDRIFRVAQ